MGLQREATVMVSRTDEGLRQRGSYNWDKKRDGAGNEQERDAQVDVSNRSTEVSGRFYTYDTWLGTESRQRKIRITYDDNKSKPEYCNNYI